MNSMRFYLRSLLFIYFSFCVVALSAQYSMGMTGLLNIPTADMQVDGTFIMGTNFLPREMLPEEAWTYNAGNYFLTMTLLPCLEVGYRCTLMKVETGKWNQDRAVSLRLRPLKEGRYWPSVVLGSNDVFTSGHLNVFSEVNGNNRYFSSIYAVVTKHLQPAGHDLSFSLGWNVPFRKSANRDGMFGGMSYSPAFCRSFSLMAEYDDRAVNLGVGIRLFNHFTAHVFCYDLEAVSCGLRYELVLLKKKGEKR